MRAVAERVTWRHPAWCRIEGLTLVTFALLVRAAAGWGYAVAPALLWRDAKRVGLARVVLAAALLLALSALVGTSALCSFGS